MLWWAAPKARHGSGDRGQVVLPAFISPTPEPLMTRRRQPTPSWMGPYVPPATLEAHALALEARLRARDGLPPSWPDALARCPLPEAEWWGD